MARAAGHRLVEGDVPRPGNWTEDDRIAAARRQRTDPFRVALVEDWGRAEWEASGAPLPAVADRGSADRASRVALRARGFAGLTGAEGMYMDTENAVLEVAMMASADELREWVRWMTAARETDLHAAVARASAVGIGRALFLASRLDPARFPSVPSAMRGTRRWGEGVTPSPIDVLAVFGRLGEVWEALPRGTREDERMGFSLALAALRGAAPPLDAPAAPPLFYLVDGLDLLAREDKTGALWSDLATGGGEEVARTVLAALAAYDGEMTESLAELAALAWAEGGGAEEYTETFRGTFPEMEDILVRVALGRGDAALVQAAMCSAAFPVNEVCENVADMWHAFGDTPYSPDLVRAAFAGGPWGRGLQRTGAESLLAASLTRQRVPLVMAVLHAAAEAGESIQVLTGSAIDTGGAAARRALLQMWRDAPVSGTSLPWEMVQVAALRELIGGGSIATLLKHGGVDIARRMIRAGYTTAETPAGWTASSPELWRGSPTTVAVAAVREALTWGWPWRASDITLDTPEPLLIEALQHGVWSPTEPGLWDEVLMQRRSVRLAREVLRTRDSLAIRALAAQRIAQLLGPARRGDVNGARWGETPEERAFARDVLVGADWEPVHAALEEHFSTRSSVSGPLRKRARRTVEGPGCKRCRFAPRGCVECIPRWINTAGTAASREDILACLHGSSPSGRTSNALRTILAAIIDPSLREELRAVVPL